MQVILKEDVANLGYKDDVVTVKSGYGRNYLIPQGKAVIASPSALKVREEENQLDRYDLRFCKQHSDCRSPRKIGTYRRPQTNRY